MSVMTRSQRNNLSKKPQETSETRKTAASCSTNKNGNPPCKEGFYQKMNSKKEECCYKERKPSGKKTIPGKDNTTDILSKIEEQNVDIKDMIFSKLSPRTMGKVIMHSTINIEGDLQTKGEKDIKKLFNELMKKDKGSIFLPAQNHLNNEANKLCEKMRKENLSVSPSVQTKHIIEYLKRKYKHLRKGRFHRLTKIEKEKGVDFWMKLENFDEERADHASFKEAIQNSIDLFFYEGSKGFVDKCIEKLRL